MSTAAPAERETTIAAALASACDRLAAAGVEAPRQDARLLLEAAAGLETAHVIAYPERALDPAALARFQAAIDRRAGREPVSRILGRRAFWKHVFLVGSGSLDPRPDSELLVEQALRLLAPDATGLVVDLGVGSGCLLLSVLAERPALTGLGVDISGAALAVAAANAQALGLAGRCLLLQTDWASALRDHIADCVIANPPYIRSSTIAALTEEVRGFDPRAALDGGADGLEAYRRLAPQLPVLLKPTATLLLEIGHDQASAVSTLLAAAGMVVELPVADLAGRDRCLIATAAAL